jgi:hypothetical protein
LFHYWASFLYCLPMAGQSENTPLFIF